MNNKMFINQINDLEYITQKIKKQRSEEIKKIIRNVLQDKCKGTSANCYEIYKVMKEQIDKLDEVEK